VGSAPEGFEYRESEGVVTVLHHGKVAARLRGLAAAKFLDEIEGGHPQLLMARITGNYRRGNERTARQHPRNA
jgi:hypothetical protein